MSMSQKPGSGPKPKVSALLVGLFSIFLQVLAGRAQTVGEGPARGYPQPRFNGGDRLHSSTPVPASAQMALGDAARSGVQTMGGLWLSGDTEAGLRRLRWIAGNQPDALLEVDARSKVSFNRSILAQRARVMPEHSAREVEPIESLITSDEGLLLLTEVISGPYRYLLHVGNTAPTLAGHIKLISVFNLDNNFDSRISPHRPYWRKAPQERPPEGFDCVIAINPDARWFNVNENQFVPVFQVTFHELAEAHARLVLGLDYLPQGESPGAHDVAVRREVRLKEERPAWVVVPTIGTNLSLTSPEDWRMLIVRFDCEQKLDRHRPECTGTAFR